MNLNGTAEAIEDVEYPCSTVELVEDCGDAEVEYVGGSTTVSELLDGVDDSTLASAEDARLELFNRAPADAVGRRGYSDRDPDPRGVESEQVSF